MTASGGKRRFLLALCLSGFLLFSGLGVWQIERRIWKLNLIERANARLRAEPVAPPGPQSPLRHEEYRRVRATGIFLHGRETLVDALTASGAGHWVLTPLQTADGIILVNRGFVPPDRSSPKQRLAGQVSGQTTVTGLLRPSEPGGRFLRPNRPAQDRFYSRDVAAIAKRRGLINVLPFFVDADAAPNPGGFPIGGLTVVAFRNAHLIYALTWFALAGICLVGVSLLLKDQSRDG